MTPVGDKVLLMLPEVPKTTPGGIALPEAYLQPPNKGMVVAAGPGRLLDNGQRATMGVRVGDDVLIHGFAGERVEVDGGVFWLISEQDILAVLEEE